MARVRLCEAIVLRTYDVGEADRFCLFFTREHGMVSARAYGARRLHSVLGAGVLPFRYVHIELTQTHNCSIVRSARAMADTEVREPITTSSLALLSRGIELLLHLVEEEEPLPQIFDLLRQFVHAMTAQTPHASCPFTVFTLRLLHLLGLLALEPHDGRFGALLPEEQYFVRFCTCCEDFSVLCMALPRGENLAKFARALIPADIGYPWKVLEEASVF